MPQLKSYLAPKSFKLFIQGVTYLAWSFGCFFLKKIKQKPCLIHVDFGLMNDSILFPPFFQKAFLKNLKKWSERRMYVSSKGIVMLSEISKEIICKKWHQLNRNHIRVIYCSSDTKKFEEVKAKRSEEYILFTGSLGRYYMLDEMIAFFLELKKKHNQLVLYIVSREFEKSTTKNQRIGSRKWLYQMFFSSL